MRPLLVVVEGYTEESVVKKVLAPHLLAHGVVATPIVVTTSRSKQGNKRKGGGSNWELWRNDIHKLWGDPRPELRVTTLLDLYALPKNFPELERHKALHNTAQRCDKLERAMAADINERRFIPYIQRHEIESLVLAALPSLEKLLDTKAAREGLEKLKADIRDFAPEDVNDGSLTAPSRRLKQFIAGYEKDVHGPLAIEDAGLPRLRVLCPRFGTWLEKLETP